MNDNEDVFLKKLLPTLDFSKQFNPGHKERLRKALFERSRELSEAELENIHAAGTPFAAETQPDKEADEIRRKTDGLKK